MAGKKWVADQATELEEAAKKKKSGIYLQESQYPDREKIERKGDSLGWQALPRDAERRPSTECTQISRQIMNYYGWK